MGRTRPRTRKIKPVVTENTAEDPPPQPSISALLERAQALIVQCDYDLAGRFARRILEREAGHVEAKEILGVSQLETGELFAAKEVRSVNRAHNLTCPKPRGFSVLIQFVGMQTFESLIPPNPGAPTVPPPSAYLYLAQLSEDDPRRALQHYQSAVDILS